jgi:hypothetical protein
MAKAKIEISKVSDKLAKVNENFSVYMYDNGYMLEISGKDADNEYKTAKIMVVTSEQLIALIAEIVNMERDS